MPKPLSLDPRSRVLAAVDAGLSCRQAAERFGVSASSADEEFRAWVDAMRGLLVRSLIRRVCREGRLMITRAMSLPA